MRLLFISLMLLSFPSHAGLDHLTIKSLSFDYAAPKGSGTIDKLQIGMSKSINEAVEVERIGDTYVARTTFLDFQWIDPWKFLFDIPKAKLTGVNLSAGNLKHSLQVPIATIDYKGEYKVLNGDAVCEGTSELPILEDRLLEDCRDSMRIEADRIDVPIDFFLVDLLSRLPQPQEEEPLKYFTLTSKDGEFYFYFLASYVVKAGLRAWGEVHYEDELKTMVIRVDLIKFGILPITGLVMKELKERIKDPRVEVNPPLIKIRMRE